MTTPFDPDEYLRQQQAQPFDPDAYLGTQTPAPAPAPAPERDFSALDYATAPAENLASMFTGVVGEIAGGLAGTLSIPFVGAENAGDVVESVSDALTYQPRSKVAQESQRAFGEQVAPIAEWISEKPAELAYNLASDPNFKAFAYASRNPVMMAAADNPAVAASAGATAIPAMMEILGIKGVSKVRTTRQLKKQLAENIANNDISMDNIRYTIDANKNLITNPRTKRLQKLFPDEETGTRAALTFEQLGSADRKQVIKMLDMVQEGRRKGRTYVIENRPADVIGQGIQARLGRLLQIRKKASQQMDSAIKKLGKKQVDITAEADAFISQLDGMGIGITRNKAGNYKIDTSRANILLGDSVKASDIEQILNNLDRGVMNGQAAHKLKKLAQSTVTYDSKFAGKPASVELENSVKGLAAKINDKLRPLSKDYARANDTYSGMADVLAEAQKRLRGIDVESEIAGKRFGNLAKRIASNFTSRDDIIALVDGLDGALADNKIYMKSNLKKQVAALAELEELFKLEKQQSPFGFQGRIQTVVEGATDPNMAAVRGVDSAIDKLRAMRKPDFDERVAAVKKMLEEQQR